MLLYLTLYNLYCTIYLFNFKQAIDIFHLLHNILFFEQEFYSRVFIFI